MSPVEMFGQLPKAGEPTEISLWVDGVEVIEITSSTRETDGVAVLAGDTPIISAFTDEVTMTLQKSADLSEELKQHKTEHEDGPDAGRVYHTIFLKPGQTINIKPAAEGELLTRTSPSEERTTVEELNIKNLFLPKLASPKEIDFLDRPSDEGPDIEPLMSSDPMCRM